MNDPLRTLARSVEYQNLYARAKELNINLFNNITDFSALQLRFLQYLELYHNLYNKLNSEEKLLNNERIKDDMLVDAYLTYQYKNKDKNNKNKGNGKGASKNSTHVPQIMFKKRRKS